MLSNAEQRRRSPSEKILLQYGKIFTVRRSFGYTTVCLILFSNIYRLIEEMFHSIGIYYLLSLSLLWTTNLYVHFSSFLKVFWYGPA